jgi:hypothetical protein
MEKFIHCGKTCHRRVWWLALCTILVLSPALAADPPSSASFILLQSTLNSAGEAGTSPSYNLDSSLGQELTIGASSSHHLVVQSGFWGFVGSALVPVVLQVDRNPVNVGNVDLYWSGNNPLYDIYQSTDCTDVYSTYHASTANNDYTNISPPTATLVCYSVLATAPGPIVPPDTRPVPPRGE